MLARWLQRLTENPLERKNIVWMTASGLFGAAGGALVAGTVLQTYLVKAGLANEQIGLIGSASAVAGSTGMFLLMGLGDRVQRRIRTVVICNLIAALAPCVLTALSIVSAGPHGATVILATLVALAIFLSPIGSLQTMVGSSLTVRVLRVSLRGRLTGISGFLGGLAAMGMGLVAANLLRTRGYPDGFTFCFAGAVVLSVAASLCLGRLTELPELARPGRTGSASPFSAIWFVFSLREFRILLAPNTLRGLAGGFTYFVTAMGLKRLNLSVDYGGLMAAVGAAAGIAGTVAIGLFVDRWGPGPVCFLGDILVALALLGLVLTKWPLVFLAFYLLMAFGGTLEGSGVPLGTYEIAPAEVMGAFNGARLMLLSIGSGISMWLVGRLLDSFHPLPVFVAGALVYVINGFLYHSGFRRRKRLVR